MADTPRSIEVAVTPVWPGPWTIEMTLQSVSLEVMAVLTDIPLVDLSIDWDTHIIRGEN